MLKNVHIAINKLMNNAFCIQTFIVPNLHGCQFSSTISLTSFGLLMASLLLPENRLYIRLFPIYICFWTLRISNQRFKLINLNFDRSTLSNNKLMIEAFDQVVRRLADLKLKHSKITESWLSKLGKLVFYWASQLTPNKFIVYNIARNVQNVKPFSMPY